MNWRQIHLNVQMLDVPLHPSVYKDFFAQAVPLANNWTQPKNIQKKFFYPEGQIYVNLVASCVE